MSCGDLFRTSRTEKNIALFECWIYEPDNTVATTTQSAMAEVTAFKPEQNGTFPGSDWCQYQGEWND